MHFTCAKTHVKHILSFGTVPMWSKHGKLMCNIFECLSTNHSLASALFVWSVVVIRASLIIPVLPMMHCLSHYCGYLQGFLVITVLLFIVCNIPDPLQSSQQVLVTRDECELTCRPSGTGVHYRALVCLWGRELDGIHSSVDHCAGVLTAAENCLRWGKWKPGI